MMETYRQAEPDFEETRIHGYIEPKEFILIKNSTEKTEKGEKLLLIMMKILNQDCSLNNVSITRKEAMILLNRLEDFISA